MAYKHLQQTNSWMLYRNGYKRTFAQQSCWRCCWRLRSYGCAMRICCVICTGCFDDTLPCCEVMPLGGLGSTHGMRCHAYVMPCRHAARMRSQRKASTPSQQCRARPAPTHPPPYSAPQRHPPHAPIGPGALSHTHRGLPLALNKTGFGTAMGGAFVQQS